MSFLTFGSNFSLIVREFLTFHSEFLTFGHLSSKFLTFGSNFSLLATFPVKFSLFQKISHFSSRPHSHAGQPFSCRRPAPSHPGPPNDMVTTMLLAYSDGQARVGRHVLMGRHAKKQKTIKTGDPGKEFTLRLDFGREPKTPKKMTRKPHLKIFLSTHLPLKRILRQTLSSRSHKVDPYKLAK